MPLHDHPRVEDAYRALKGREPASGTPVTGAEPIHERLRHSREGRADDDGVVRGRGRLPQGPVAAYDLGIADALPGRPRAGLVGQVGPVLDADDVRGRAGRQRGLPALSGPGLRDLFVSCP